MSKQCKKCGAEKPLASFYKHPTCKDGREGVCKACKREATANWRLDNPSKAKAHQHQRDKEKSRATQARYRLRNRDKVVARTKLCNAIRDGKIARPASCSVCYCECQPEAHHDNYKKPLEVRWLCKACHTDFHKLDKALNELV